MKIYTKTGDNGTTSLFGGQRVLKSNERVEAYGMIDELNAHIGIVRDIIDEKTLRDFLLQIQNDLFVMGAYVATPPEKKQFKSGKNRLSIRMIEEADIEKMEHKIDEFNQVLSPMTHFILPGGHVNLSYCHIARTVCRRVERQCVKLSQIDDIELIFIQYLNRLSDFLFVLARKLAKDLQIEEVKWDE